MRFTSPVLLILLLTLLPVALLGWPSRSFAWRRELVSLILRLIIAVCLIFSLAGLEVARAADELAVVFLIDVSDSMPDSAKAAAVGYVRQSLAGMGPDDRAAVIAFGDDALVERAMSPARTLDPITSVPGTVQTDLSAAIRLGLALYPPGVARRMVILSDGAATRGDALAAARLAQATGVEIVALPFVVQPGAEALITDVQVPARLRQDERFDLQLSLHATEPMRAGVRVLAGDRVVYQGVHDLDAGNQSFSLPLTAGEPGFARYAVQIDPDLDGYYQNNELAAFSQVEGPPTVLLIALPAGESLTPGGEPRPDEFSSLVSALEASGFVVDTARPSGLPSELAELASYDSVVLVDVPARELNPRQLSTLQAYVRDLGGGLVAVGGPTSFGVGGYFRTPLEETLPVEMQIKDEQRRPALAIVFIIDRSGSMADVSGGAMKLSLAKEAAVRSVALLFPSDHVGVITFDDAAGWVVPLAELADPDPVIAAIGSIRAGGGTNIMSGIQVMARALPDDPATLKHVILLTDGGADATGIPQLVQQLYQDNGITLSAVGIGTDAATAFLEQLAQAGGGRYHFAASPAAIPSIFTEETTLATRAYLVEETFFPKLSSASSIVAGITDVPPLHGYVATTAKAAAQTILVSAQNDPILAAWQYGLGKSVAFTSDASGRWARDWIGWPSFPAFWAQAVRFTVGDVSRSVLDVRVEPTGAAARLVIDARAANGDYLNGYSLQANVVGPDGRTETVDARQVAPGRYEATFEPGTQGAYLIGVSAQPSSPNESAATQTAGWVLSYSPEYRNLESDPDALYRIVAAAGGKIATDNPGEVFAHTLAASNAARPIWPWLLAVAALLLPFDVAVRRLIINRSDVRRAWEKIAARLARRPTLAPARSQRIDTLFQVKERTRSERASDQPPLVPPVAPVATPPAEPSDAEAKPAKPAAPSSETATAASLLARKRSRREQDK